MENTRVQDIMIPLDDYPHVPYWFSLHQVMATMEKSTIDFHGRKSLPRIVLVFDQDYQLCGWARRRDILRGLEPEFLGSKSFQYSKKLFDVKIDPNLSELSHDRVIKGFRERVQRPISDVMRPVTTTIDYHDHILKVICEMVDNDLSLIPVMHENRVVGVVRSVDVFHEVADMLLGEETK
jgi:CBS-domain-containing membrane protein